MKKITEEQMSLFVGGIEVGRCVWNSVGYFVAASSFVTLCMALPALVPFMVAAGGVVVAAEGMRRNC